MKLLDVDCSVYVRGRSYFPSSKMILIRDFINGANVSLVTKRVNENRCLSKITDTSSYWHLCVVFLKNDHTTSIVESYISESKWKNIIKTLSPDQLSLLSVSGFFSRICSQFQHILNDKIYLWTEERGYNKDITEEHYRCFEYDKCIVRKLVCVFGEDELRDFLPGLMTCDCCGDTMENKG